MPDVFNFAHPEYHDPVLNNHSGQGASIFTTVVSQCATAIGAGVLALIFAAGRLGYGNTAIFFGLSAFLAFFTFILIGRAVVYLSAYNYEAVVRKAFNTKAGVAVSLLIITYLLGVVAVYFILIADSFANAMAFLTGTNPDQRYVFLNYRVLVIVFAYCIVFPLALKKTLHALKLFSAFALVAILYVVGYLMYVTLRFLSTNGSVDLRNPELIGRPRNFPAFNWSPLSAVFLSMSTIAFAFSSHLAAPNIVRELHKLSFKRLDFAAFCAFVFISIVYATTIVFGFLLFGDSGFDNLLLSLDFNTLGAFFANAGVVVLLVVSAAIVLAPSKDQSTELIRRLSSYDRMSWLRGAFVDDLAVQKPPLKTFSYVLLVLVLISLSVLIALISEDIGDLVSFLGAFIASFLVFLLPSIVYWKVVPEKSLFGLVVTTIAVFYGLVLFTMGGYFSFINLF
ncbi:hypothetical protein RCL1_006024 [Eukaryota sp. TZLM3-RCL]